MVSSRLPAALLSLWPDYLGYFPSFVGTSAFWLIHHSIFRPIRSYDRTLLYLNSLCLMVVAIVPFPTSLLGEYGDHQLPMAIYAATLAVGRLLLTATHWYSTRNHQLLDEPQDHATVRFYLRRGLTIPTFFLFSIAISFFSVAICSWLVMLAVDAVVIYRRFRLSCAGRPILKPLDASAWIFFSFEGWRCRLHPKVINEEVDRKSSHSQTAVKEEKCSDP